MIVTYLVRYTVGRHTARSLRWCASFDYQSQEPLENGRVGECMIDGDRAVIKHRAQKPNAIGTSSAWGVLCIYLTAHGQHHGPDHGYPSHRP